MLGVPPQRIDILSHLDGVAGFASAWRRRRRGVFGATPAHYLSLDDLIANKRVVGRDQDKADLKPLLRARARQVKR